MKKISVAIILVAVLMTGLLIAKYKKQETNVSQNKEDTKINKEIKILFVGDMMFDRHIRQAVQKNGQGFVFQKVENLLLANDLVVGNLEGPVTENQSVSVGSKIGEPKNFIFTFDPKILQELDRENIKLVNIGNNHINNFGKKGIESTRENLEKAGINFFGDPSEDKNRFKLENIKGVNIAFINYNQFIDGAKEKTLEDIKKAKEIGANLVLVYTHWGTEYVGEPGQSIKDLAHEFIDQGADAIIGSHPHVVQSKEEYKGKMIYYSLGNFIFDQYFNAKNQNGLAVEMDVDLQGKLSFIEHKIFMDKNGQTSALN